MIIWRQKFLPLTGHKAVFLAGILFVRKEAKMNERDLNHERIHSRQFTELAVTGLLISIPFAISNLWAMLIGASLFYIWYLIEYLVKCVKFRDSHEAYRAISFEREAYLHESTTDYLKDRQRFNWWRYL